MISVRQLFRNRLEDGSNLSNKILLPIVVQVYEFHEFWKRKTFEAPQKRK